MNKDELRDSFERRYAARIGNDALVSLMRKSRVGDGYVTDIDNFTIGLNEAWWAFFEGFTFGCQVTNGE